MFFTPMIVVGIAPTMTTTNTNVAEGKIDVAEKDCKVVMVEPLMADTKEDDDDTKQPMAIVVSSGCGCGLVVFVVQ